MSLVAIVGHNAKTFLRNMDYLNFMFLIAKKFKNTHYILCTYSGEEQVLKTMFNSPDYPIYDIIRYDLLMNEDITTFILPEAPAKEPPRALEKSYVRTFNPDITLTCLGLA